LGHKTWTQIVISELDTCW